MLLRSLFESANKTAVLGWGRGMGHKGHMLLAQAVIHHAGKINAEPFFVVSRTTLIDPSTGDIWADRKKVNTTKDDPLTPDEKLATYKKVFPDQSHIFSVATEDASTLLQVMGKLSQQGFKNIVLVVGKLEVAGFGYLSNPDKSGTSPIQQIGLNDLKIISRQDTNAPGSDVNKPDYQEGPRATPMRAVLMDPTKSEEEQFAVWRRDMPDNLSDEEIMDLMQKAKDRLVKAHAPVVRGKKSVNEFAMSHGDDEDPFDNYPCYDCGSTIFLHHTKLCELAEPNAKHDLPSKPGSQHWTGEVPKGLHTIPGLKEADSPAIAHTAKSLENPPKVMQHRAKRDQERERQWMGTQIAKNDRTSKDEWGDLKQECAGVGTITKQNSTPDVNKNTPMKNLKAFKLAELSSEKLGQYKKAADAQASAADKAGDTKKADKRFSGIVKATKKQFANDEKISEKMMPTSMFAGSKKNKLGPAGQLKGSMKRPARAGDLVGGDMEEEKQRLDPSCWKGYRKQGTKMKGGVRVNNCVPVSEDVENIMDVLINKIIVNEAIQNKQR